MPGAHRCGEKGTGEASLRRYRRAGRAPRLFLTQLGRRRRASVDNALRSRITFIMVSVVKTVKLSPALAARIRASARASRRNESVVIREALARGLDDAEGIDRAAALAPFTGKAATGVRRKSLQGYGRPRHR